MRTENPQQSAAQETELLVALRITDPGVALLILLAPQLQLKEAGVV